MTLEAVRPTTRIAPADVARDLGAVVLLLGALALPWDIDHDGHDRWWVVVAVACSVLSLAAPYLVAGGSGPGSEAGARRSRAVKWVLAAPFLVSVAVLVINAGQHLFGDLYDDLELAGGIGGGVGVGLAGALLALQPRANDVDPSGRSDLAWARSAGALLGLGLIAVVITTAVWTGRFGGDLAELRWTLALFDLFVLGGYVVPFAVPLVGLARGSREWARVLAVAGFTVIGVQLCGGLQDGTKPGGLFSGFRVEHFQYVAGIFLLAGGTALVVARPLQRRLSSPDPAATWTLTARAACLLSAAVLGVLAARLALGLTTEDMLVLQASDGRRTVALVLTVAGIAAALALHGLLGGGAAGRTGTVAVVIAVAIVALGIAAHVAGHDRVPGWQLTAGEVVGWFAMPALVLWSLLAPERLRAGRAPA